MNSHTQDLQPSDVQEVSTCLDESEFDKGTRQGLAQAQWIAELAVRDGRDVVEAIRDAQINAQPLHIRTPWA
jgi:hypothetical protein